MQWVISRQGQDRVCAWDLIYHQPLHSFGEVAVGASQVVEVVKDLHGRYFHRLHLAGSIGCSPGDPLIAKVAVLSDIYLNLRQ
eukprot:8371524-Ditylum_brightwellii.AAC.1